MQVIARRTEGIFIKPESKSVRVARDETAAILGHWGVSWVAIETARQIVSELVTNSVNTAKEADNSNCIEVTLGLDAFGVLVKVRDTCPGTPRMRRADPMDESGRGLFMVAALATKWGTDNFGIWGKAVWARVALETGR